MTYKFPNIPNSKAYVEETADFWEIQAIENPGIYVSKIQISKIIARELDELTHEGIESEDDLIDDGLDDVFNELTSRIRYTNKKYPFDFSKYSIKYNYDLEVIKDVYLYLLLCTRFNMNTQKVQNEIDGTLLFERLCAFVASEYFGENSQSYVFGTASNDTFEDKIKEIISKLGEGKAFKNPNDNKPTKNDDSVDIIVWKEFSDLREGKLIGFGQCKTGTTTWRDEKHKLKPDEFCNNWFYQQPVLNPIPILFIADTMNEDYNFYSSQKGFLVFNRFRILEYINNDIPLELFNDVKKWVEGALNVLNIQE